VAYTSEIEKLEKRWAENPKGRNFAPLADAYRKAGELDRAIELCTAGLKLHPDYVSAHIVFARCLMDQKNDAGASDVFRKVLALDPENVLALKILAELAERGGRYDEEVDWLTRLLAADPMNGDAAEALTRAKGKAAQGGLKAPATEPIARLVPEPAFTRAAAPSTPRVPPPPPAPRPAAPPPPRPQADVVVEHASEGAVAPDVSTQSPASGIETFDGTIDFDTAAHGAARAEGLEVQEEVELKPQELVVEGLARTQFESGQFAPPAAGRESDDALPVVDLPLIMPDDVSAVTEAPPPAPPPPLSAPPAPAAVALADDDGAADTAALSRAEPVLTETMADLYLRQGHQEDALRVYQALLAQRPGDARLRARVDRLLSGDVSDPSRATGESVQAFLRRILAGRLALREETAPAPEAPPPAEPEPSGSPLDGAFSIAPLEPDVAPEIAAPGEATRPAVDSISLDAVFGEETPRTSAPVVQAPEPVATERAPASAGSPPSGGFSFDQFFSPPTSASSPPSAPPSLPPPASPAGAPSAADAALPKNAPRSSGAKSRPPQEDEGDLDQFQAWLRGLKS